MPRRDAFTLPEAMAAVAILGLLAAMAVVRYAAPHATVKARSCHACQAEIELQTQLWYRANGSYPTANLSNIGSSLTYFPQGVPTCPVDGTTYTIDTTTGLVVGHNH